jgi:putative tryptophan/tyrosine transport system substrate-binding protein
MALNIPGCARRLNRIGKLILATYVLATVNGAVGSVTAAEVAVIVSAGVDAYREALQGFKGTVRHRIAAEYDMEGNFDRGKKIVDEIQTKVKPDLILTIGPWAFQVAAAKTTNIPLVYAMVLNPPSIIPAGAKNITGASMNVPVESIVQVFKQLGRKIRRLGVVFNRAHTGYLMTRAEQVIRDQGLELVAKEVRSPKEAIQAIDSLQDEKIHALWILPDETILTPEVIQYMVLFSFRSKVPLLGLSERQAQMGALLSLSFGSSEDIGRQAAELANSILEGKSPDMIPYTMARKLKLTVNLKAAEKLGIEVPKSVLGTAQSVIQ